MPKYGRTINRIRSSLYCALDSSAPDEESWLKGRGAFYASLMQGLSLEEALSTSLDSCAPDEESWHRGYAAFSGRRSDAEDLSRPRELFRNLFKDRS